MSYEIRPIPEDQYEGRQYGYLLLRDGRPYLRCTTGGTGPCWNLQEAVYSVMAGGEMEPAIDVHVCDLDDLIGALQALRDSDAYTANEERWA